MPIQSEAALEEVLISALQKRSYEYVQIKEETNLKENFKKQLEIHTLSFARSRGINRLLR